MNQIQIQDTRAVAYIRQSTTEQENGLEAQRQDIESYAKREGIEIANIFVDFGTSAYSTHFMERPVVQEMLNYMQANAVGQMIFTKLDRAFRNVRDCVCTVDALAQQGLRFHITQMKIDTGTAMGKAFLHFMALMAELENGVRSERQLAAFDVMRSQGHRAGAVPYGWDPVPAGNRTSRTGRPADNLVPNEAEQDVLRWILTHHKQGWGDNAMAQSLNDHAIPSKRGGRWHASTVHSVRTHAKLSIEPNQKAA